MKRKSLNIPVPPPKWVMHRIDNDISYNATNGEIRWLNSPANKIKPGDLAGSINNGYIKIEFCRNGERCGVLAQHIAYYKMRGVWPPRQLDHRNTRKHSNRWRNLRLASDSQNRWNINYKPNTLGVTGVTKRTLVSCDKYEARISCKGKYIFLGYFDTIKDAAKARKRAEKKYFRKFRYKGN